MSCRFVLKHKSEEEIANSSSKQEYSPYYLKSHSIFFYMDDGLENFPFEFHRDLRLGGPWSAKKTRIKRSWQTKEAVCKTKE